MPSPILNDAFSKTWRPILLAYFLRRVRDHSEADDLTQELMTRLLLKTEVTIESPEAYVFQMASNLLADRARRAKVRDSYSRMLMSDDRRGIDILDPHRVTVSRAELTLLATALAELPERTRTIFILYRIEDFAQDAIADAFGISVSAVKKHVARAMASLAQTMKASS